MHQKQKHLLMTVELLSLRLSLKLSFLFYTSFFFFHRLEVKFEWKHISVTIRAAGGLGLYLLVNGTQQLCKPVEGLELPADPHEIQPLQPEVSPAVPGWDAAAAWWGRSRKHEHEHRGLQLLTLIYRHLLTAGCAAHRRTGWLRYRRPHTGWRRSWTRPLTDCRRDRPRKSCTCQQETGLTWLLSFAQHILLIQIVFRHTPVAILFLNAWVFFKYCLQDFWSNLEPNS